MIRQYFLAFKFKHSSFHHHSRILITFYQTLFFHFVNTNKIFSIFSDLLNFTLLSEGDSKCRKMQKIGLNPEVPSDLVPKQKMMNKSKEN
ncbi:hypothetical protein BpHYR1_031244 [Brachionus plicatilis]|uniref:Uncharacterized protein n=1 Tax=Brachionus plicatilis TaxID=10195 RepID=A0A3M7RZS4_BRAPC|nr:hypothetical protein BpHYR1_031244 [Brachionus plicatilis]